MPDKLASTTFSYGLEVATDRLIKLHTLRDVVTFESRYGVRVGKTRAIDWAKVISENNGMKKSGIWITFSSSELKRRIGSKAWSDVAWLIDEHGWIISFLMFPPSCCGPPIGIGMVVTKSVTDFWVCPYHSR